MRARANELSFMACSATDRADILLLVQLKYFHIQISLADFSLHSGNEGGKDKRERTPFD